MPYDQLTTRFQAATTPDDARYRALLRLLFEQPTPEPKPVGR